jgi:hypothetical protein
MVVVAAVVVVAWEVVAEAVAAVVVEQKINRRQILFPVIKYTQKNIFFFLYTRIKI